MQFALDTDPMCLVIIFFKLIKGRISFPSMLAFELFKKSELNCPSPPSVAVMAANPEALMDRLKSALAAND